MVIDMPPGTGDIQLTMAQELPIKASILVTTPQLVSTDDVSRAVMMFKEINVPIAGNVENMSYFVAPDTGKRYDIFGKGGGEKVARKNNISLLGQVPLDMEIREGSDKGEPPAALGFRAAKKVLSKYCGQNAHKYHLRYLNLLIPGRKSLLLSTVSFNNFSLVDLSDQAERDAASLSARMTLQTSDNSNCKMVPKTNQSLPERSPPLVSICLLLNSAS